MTRPKKTRSNEVTLSKFTQQGLDARYAGAVTSPVKCRRCGRMGVLSGKQVKHKFPFRETTYCEVEL